jgi:hypothetical protein
MNELDNKAVFKDIFEFSTSWCSAVNGGQSPIKKVWNLPNGSIEAFVWNNQAIPKTGLSFIEMEGTLRVGLNIYVRSPVIPDGSFAVLLAQQEDLRFIGGVLELFPTVSIEEDIDGFRTALNKITKNHKMDSDQLRQGLVGAFSVGGEEKNLGAEAGFNFYRAGLDATSENLIFAQEAFIRSLEEYQAILKKREASPITTSFKEKELSWEKHLRFMKEDDIGIKMALEQGLPMDFFSFSTFPPY